MKKWTILILLAFFIGTACAKRTVVLEEFTSGT
jgi:hypothetical protein